MRKFIAIFVFVTAGVAAFLAFSVWPSRAPIALRLVSSKPLGSVNGKQFTQLTVSISNRENFSITFNPVDDLQAKVRGQWIEVDQDFGASVKGCQAIQKRLYVPEGVEACRFRFKYYVDYQRPRPTTWMSRSLGKLGPQAVSWVAKSPWLRKWFWPGEWEPGWNEITLEVEIPAGDSTPDELSPSTLNHALGLGRWHRSACASVERPSAGERSQFRRVVRRHWPGLLSFAR